MDLRVLTIASDTTRVIGVLTEVAERLTNLVRRSDTVARLGGDEFAIVIENIAVGSILGVTTVAQKIIDTIRKPFIIDDLECTITTSVGVSLYPLDGGDATTLIKRADLAMYQAKESGKSNFFFFSSQLNEKAHRRIDLEGQLRDALINSEFVLNISRLSTLKQPRSSGSKHCCAGSIPAWGISPPMNSSHWLRHPV